MSKTGGSADVPVAIHHGWPRWSDDPVRWQLYELEMRPADSERASQACGFLVEGIKIGESIRGYAIERGGFFGGGTWV